jgi:hypothetical protein
MKGMLTMLPYTQEKHQMLLARHPSLQFSERRQHVAALAMLDHL